MMLALFGRCVSANSLAGTLPASTKLCLDYHFANYFIRIDVTCKRKKKEWTAIFKLHSHWQALARDRRLTLAAAAAVAVV